MHSSLGRINSRLIQLKPLLRSLKYILPIKYDVHIFLRYEGIPQPSRIPFPGTFHEATPDDLPRLVECNPKPHRFAERFQHRDRCFVAESKTGQIVGYEWLSEPPYHFEQKYHYRIPIPDNTFYLYDAYILPEYRISGIWLGLKAKIGEVMQSEGKQALITYISHDNHLSFRTHFRFGFQIFERVSVLSIGPLGFTRRQPMAHTQQLVQWLSFPQRQLKGGSSGSPNR